MKHYVFDPDGNLIEEIEVDEPELPPVVDEPSLDERVTAIENAITKGLSL